MTNRYEVLMLAVPEITQDETKQIENELDKIINAAKGKILSFERWGKFKLTYPIRNNEYGVYFLVRFDVPNDLAVLQEIQNLYRVRLNGLVMRHMVSRLDANASTEYQRPKSLEEAPTSRDMDSFLKENKMEGLLGMDSDDDDSDEPSIAATASARPTRIAKVVSNEKAEQEESRADQ